MGYFDRKEKKPACITQNRSNYLVNFGLNNKVRKKKNIPASRNTCQMT